MPKGWSVGDVPSLRGTTAVVTGANSGIGWEAARVLAAKGARVVMACRSLERAAEAGDAIRAEAPDADLDALPLDLADLDSVRAFALAFRARYARLDLLVNNAGIMAIPRRETAQGFEMQLGTNHLGHFALTGLLLDRVLAARAPRVVTVSSLVHHRGRIEFDDLLGERRYDKWSAYCQSKLANLLFAQELHRRLSAHPHVLSVACHPGYSATNLQSVGHEMQPYFLGALMRSWGNRLFAQSAASGALPTVYAATAPEVSGGDFFGPAVLGVWGGPPARGTPSRAARDPELAARLWAISEELTGVSFLAEHSTPPDSHS